MAVHMKYLSLLSLASPCSVKTPNASAGISVLLSQTCRWCRSDNSPPVMKIRLVGLVIFRFNKPNTKPPDWWRRGKLNLSPPVTRIIPLKAHLQLRVKRSLSARHKSRDPSHRSVWEPFNESPIKLSVRTRGRKRFLSGTPWWDLSLFVSTSLSENKHPHLSATH